jgi:hypothetical protein
VDFCGVSDLLPKESRILRHVPNGKYQDGKVDGSVFVPRVDGEVFQLREKLSDGMPETGLSVVSIDLLDGTDVDRINKIRATFPRKLKPSQRFAELTVADAVQLVCEKMAHLDEVEQLANLALLHTPIEATDDYPEFPLHCDITGLPIRTNAFSALVGEVISYAVTHLHPAVAEDAAAGP